MSQTIPSNLAKWIGNNQEEIRQTDSRIIIKQIRDLFGIKITGKQLFDLVYPERIMTCEKSRFISYSVGYRSCAKGCPCYIKRVSKAVANTKAKYSNDERQKINEKRKITTKKKFGHDNVFQSNDIKEKIAHTNMARYNVINPMQCEEIRKRSTQTVLERYGVENVMQYNLIATKNHENRDYLLAAQKGMVTKKERYGNPAYNNSEKTRNTCLIQFGVVNPAQKHYSQLFKQLLRNESLLIAELEKKSLAEFTNVYGVSYYIYYRLVKKYNISLENQFEKDILNHLMQLTNNIQTRSRSLIAPKEIDFFCPDVNLAIEANGSYWHTENQGRGKKYHVTKTDMCESQGIRCLHIWEHLWNSKKEIYLSILKGIFNQHDKISARKCKIIELDNKIARNFVEKNHIQGSKTSSINIGLTYQDVLVSVMTLSKPRFNPNFDYELDRFCSVLNTRVIGGASKMFKYFIDKYDPDTVLTFSDRSIFHGGVYDMLGFTFIEKTSPNYFYTKDYTHFESRFKYQKHKLSKYLENYDSKKTEYENMVNHGYDRMWDCGHSKWIWEKKISKN